MGVALPQDERSRVAEMAVQLILRALTQGKPPHKVVSLSERLLDFAYELQFQASRRAAVYPIRGGGKCYGEQPGDLYALAVADAITLEASRLRKAAAQ